MIALLAFPLIAALLILVIGRRDRARDPRLTLTLLLLLASQPLICAAMPKLAVLPATLATATPDALPWKQALWLAWLAGSGLAALRLLLSLSTIRRWRATSTLIERVGEVEVRMLSDITSPLAAGILRKVVFVPPCWHTREQAQRELILAHELTHHRRRDPLRRLCAEIACAIHWYNPLVHWMARRLALQCELACDAEVLLQGTDRSSYASLLCDLASGPRHPALAIPMAIPSTLEQRIRRIVQPACHGRVAITLAFALLGTGSALALSMLSSRALPQPPPPGETEIQLRLSADPFPGNP